MARTFGQFNGGLTKAVNRVARDESNVDFRPHAEEEMDDDGFDHQDVLTCLRRGKAYGPEYQNGRLRANVIHGGIRIRVAIGGLEPAQQDWTRLRRVIVVTVMKDK